MRTALFGGGTVLVRELPAGVLPLDRPAAAETCFWDVLAVTRRGCALLASSSVRVRCGTLLLPDALAKQALARITADRAVGVGLDRRDSLTFSSLTEGAVLCVQRTLLRPGGGTVEPEEIPLPPLTLPPEDALLLWGLRLLLDGPPE